MKAVRNTIIILTIMLSFVQPALGYSASDDNVYEHLKNWDSDFKMDYFDSDIVDVIRNEAKKDDYVYMSVIGLSCRKQRGFTNVEVKYRTTKEQELYIDNEINNIIKM